MKKCEDSHRERKTKYECSIETKHKFHLNCYSHDSCQQFPWNC